MAVAIVRAGKVKVVVTKVPLFGWRWWRLTHTITIQRADFVGLTVTRIVIQVQNMIGRGVTGRYTLDGRELTAAENATILEVGNTLELVDP